MVTDMVRSSLFAQRHRGCSRRNASVWVWASCFSLLVVDSFAAGLPREGPPKPTGEEDSARAAGSSGEAERMETLASEEEDPLRVSQPSAKRVPVGPPGLLARGGSGSSRQIAPCGAPVGLAGGLRVHGFRPSVPGARAVGGEVCGLSRASSTAGALMATSDEGVAAESVSTDGATTLLCHWLLPACASTAAACAPPCAALAMGGSGAESAAGAEASGGTPGGRSNSASARAANAPLTASVDGRSAGWIESIARASAVSSAGAECIASGSSTW